METERSSAVRDFVYLITDRILRLDEVYPQTHTTTTIILNLTPVLINAYTFDTLDNRAKRFIRYVKSGRVHVCNEQFTLKEQVTYPYYTLELKYAVVGRAVNWFAEVLREAAPYAWDIYNTHAPAAPFLNAIKKLRLEGRVP